MADLIISNATDLAEFFEVYPGRTYGRRSTYSLDTKLASDTLNASGMNAIQRAAERINAQGENMGADDILRMDNWDLI